MKAVILQPFYLPWAGYFGMIDAADIFVFADDVQFSEKSWQCRNKININNDFKWLTVPVNKKFGQKINEVGINSTVTYKNKNKILNWKEKQWELISLAYSKASHFDEYKKDIYGIYNHEWDLLCDINIFIIKKISELLNFKTQFLKKSEIKGLKGCKVDSIISICNEIGADEYISGPAARDYIDYNEFKKLKQEDIDLYWFEFPHPVYPQKGDEFLPYMSIIDLLFNTGDESTDYIQKSVENSLKIENGNNL